MDLTFSMKDGVFNYRACAVIVRDGRLLAMKDKRSPYYYLPGGRVQLHETAEKAVLREVREELQIKATIVRPLWMVQNFFTEDVTGERFHELCMYFLVDASGTALPVMENHFTGAEVAKGQEFYWLTFEQVEREYLYPLFLKKHIRSLPEQLALLTEIE